jgi:hypothetical protein
MIFKNQLKPISIFTKMILKPNFLNSVPNSSKKIPCGFLVNAFSCTKLNFQMKSMRFMLNNIIFVSLFFLLGCALNGVIKLPNPALISSDVVIVDKRSDYTKKPSGNGYLLTLGDKNYQPDILSVLNSKFKENKPANISNVHIDLKNFSSTIHNNAGQSAVSAGAIAGATGIPMFFGVPQNSISCRIQGTINNKRFDVTKYVNYKAGLFCLTLYGDAETAKAIENCINGLVLESYKVL